MLDTTKVYNGAKKYLEVRGHEILAEWDDIIVSMLDDEVYVNKVSAQQDDWPDVKFTRREFEACLPKIFQFMPDKDVSQVYPCRIDMLVFSDHKAMLRHGINITGEDWF